MANFYGVARTNYVTLSEEVAQAWADRWGLRVLREKDGGSRVGFAPGEWSDDGCFPSFDDDENEFDWAELTQHLPDGEALVVVGAGHEKLRYVAGWSEAYSNQGLVASLDINKSLLAMLKEKGFTGVTGAEY